MGVAQVKVWQPLLENAAKLWWKLWDWASDRMVVAAGKKGSTEEWKTLFYLGYALSQMRLRLFIARSPSGLKTCILIHPVVQFQQLGRPIPCAQLSPLGSPQCLGCPPRMQGLRSPRLRLLSLQNCAETCFCWHIGFKKYAKWNMKCIMKVIFNGKIKILFFW